MTTERSHDLKFDKGTIYIIYLHTNVHVHIEKMGNLSKSKIKFYMFLFVFVALRPMSTAMVIAGRSVHLTTLFPGQA